MFSYVLWLHSLFCAHVREARNAVYSILCGHSNGPRRLYDAYVLNDVGTVSKMTARPPSRILTLFRVVAFKLIFKRRQLNAVTPRCAYGQLASCILNKPSVF